MKTHLDIRHSGTIDSESTRMTFDENAIAHLMSVLTDLYSDPVMAVIREYSTNSRDSHVAAGVTRPIEIELPNEFNPVFVVRDFGLGMSLDTLRDQFSKYGWSSKRDTDEQTGMLGLGCKSALSLSSQFTIVSTFNGLRIRVLVTREADGCGAIKVVDTLATDEPNGVEIRVPGSAHQFREKVYRFFRFWEPGSVLVNGDQPPSWWADDDGGGEVFTRLDPDVLVTNNDENYVVMGGVPYPIAREEWSRHKGIIARVPIGSVNFAPSREALHYTRRTRETLATLNEFVNATMIRHLRAKVDECETLPDAHTLARDFELKFDRYGFKAWTYFVGETITEEITDDKGDTKWVTTVIKPARWRSHVTWRGRDIPNDILVVPQRTFELPMDPTPWTNDHSTRIMQDTVPIAKIKYHAVIVGHRGNHIPTNLKEKIRGFINEKFGVDLNHRNTVLVTQSIVDSNLIDFLPSPDRIVSVEDVKKWEPPKTDTPTEPEKPKLYYGLLSETSPRLAYFPTIDEKLASVTPVAWVEASRDEMRAAILRVTAGMGRVASVPQNRQDKFTTQFPTVPHIGDYLKSFYDREVETLTRWDIYFMFERNSPEGAIDRNKTYSDTLDKIIDHEMRPNLIDDPDLRELVETYRWDSRSNNRIGRCLPSVIDLCERLGVALEPIPPSGLIPKLRATYERYPLIRMLRGTFYRHHSEYSYHDSQRAYDYLNAQYRISQQLNLHPFTY